MSGFVVNLSLLRDGATRLEAAADGSSLDLPADEWPGPVEGRFTVEKSGDRVSVRGALHATARLECVRCLERFDLPVDVPFEVFAERSGSTRRDDEAQLERDDLMRFHDGRQLDLRGDVREALLVEVPMTPRCREDCRGLCPRCGANLNEGPCSCSAS
jgi:uncharacterized protein